MGRTQRRAMQGCLTVRRVAMSEYGLSRRGFPRPQHKACEECGLALYPVRRMSCAAGDISPPGMPDDFSQPAGSASPLGDRGRETSTYAG